MEVDRKLIPLFLGFCKPDSFYIFSVCAFFILKSVLACKLVAIKLVVLDLIFSLSRDQSDTKLSICFTQT